MLLMHIRGQTATRYHAYKKFWSVLRKCKRHLDKVESPWKPLFKWCYTYTHAGVYVHYVIHICMLCHAASSHTNLCRTNSQLLLCLLESRDVLCRRFFQWIHLNTDNTIQKGNAAYMDTDTAHIVQLYQFVKVQYPIGMLKSANKK